MCRVLWESRWNKKTKHSCLVCVHMKEELYKALSSFLSPHTSIPHFYWNHLASPYEGNEQSSSSPEMDLAFEKSLESSGSRTVKKSTGQTRGAPWHCQSGALRRKGKVILWSWQHADGGLCRRGVLQAFQQCLPWKIISKAKPPSVCVCGFFLAHFTSIRLRILIIKLPFAWTTVL